MRVSKMGMKNVKLSNLDEMYPAQDILIQTNQVSGLSFLKFHPQGSHQVLLRSICI